jgi:predicted site-specific integrase-resolvase
MARSAIPNPDPAPRRLIGYARVSTEDQVNDAQVDELRAAGCYRIHQEHGSGASRVRPILNKLLRELVSGDVLVVGRPSEKITIIRVALAGWAARSRAVPITAS